MGEPGTKINSHNSENCRPILLELTRLFRGKTKNKHMTELPSGSETPTEYVVLLVYAQRVITLEMMYEARYVCKFCACL
jgi:hypothetical protein